MRAPEGSPAEVVALQATKAQKLREVLVVVSLGAAYIGVSTGLIAFNKHLMSKDRFPFSGGLGLLHSSSCFFLMLVVFFIRPDLFPALTSPTAKVAFDSSLIFKVVLPIAVCFVSQIVLGNQAYLFADVAFLQMLKESNVVAVYFFSVLFAMESFKWQNMRLICFIMFATWMTVEGELHFTLTGFLLQGGSFVAESVKITLQGWLLSNAGIKFDPLSYLIIVMPVCACLFAVFLFVCAVVLPPDQTIMPAPTWDDWMRMRNLLALNAVLAFALNVLGTLFIRQSSALTFVLAGILKDTMIVVMGVVLLGHETSPLQACGFGLQLMLILFWSLLKTFPKEFEDGIVVGLSNIARGKEAADQTRLEAKTASDKADYGAAAGPASRRTGHKGGSTEP